MNGGFAVIDADRHCMDPAMSWEPYLEPQYRGRVVAAGDVQLVDGRPFSRLHAPQPDRGFRNWANAPEYRQVFGEAFAAGFDPASDLRDMDREGVDVAVHFPSYGLSMTWVEGIDPDLATAVCRAYNRWMAGFCAHHPARLKAVALVPAVAPQQALAVAQEAKGLGLAGLLWRPNPLNGRTVAHPDYLPLFELAAALDLPLLVHEGSDTTLPQAGGDRVSTFTRHIACHPIEQMLACLAFCAEGVLARVPELRVGFMESGCGWAPYWVGRMDEHWEHFYFGRTRVTPEPPSFYFKRQCFVSCEAGEDLAPVFVEHLGAECLVTATDYPHPDAVDKFPHRTVGDLVSNPRLTAAVKRRVLWDNPARLYGITAPPPTG